MNTDPQHQALHCVRCDYDLRAIRIEGVCPECALPLAVSTGDAAGIRLDREWLDALQGSQRWFARVFPVVVISSGVLAFGLWWGGRSYVQLPFVYGLIVVFMFAAFAVGVFLFTHESCLRWLSTGDRHLRMLVRIFALLPIVVMLAGAACLLGLSWDVLEVVVWSVLALTIVLWLGAYLFSAFCSRIAKVLVDESIQNRVLHLRYGGLISSLAFFAGLGFIVTTAGDGGAGFGVLVAAVALTCAVSYGARVFLLPMHLADRIHVLQIAAHTPLVGTETGVQSKATFAT